MSPTDWPNEFARVLSCSACSTATDRNILRDAGENVPQPGYVGRNDAARRVALIGRNPGTPKSLAVEDKPYTSALRDLRDNPGEGTYEALRVMLDIFIPQWPVHGSYFPLAECGLTIHDIAYFDVVRCRTTGDARPAVGSVSNCIHHHFARWLDPLTPGVVVFIGKWASDRASREVERRGIPFAFMNRQRSLSSRERLENGRQVVQLVRAGAA